MDPTTDSNGPSLFALVTEPEPEPELLDDDSEEFQIIIPVTCKSFAPSSQELDHSNVVLSVDYEFQAPYHYPSCCNPAMEQHSGDYGRCMFVGRFNECELYTPDVNSYIELYTVSDTQTVVQIVMKRIYNGTPLYNVIAANVPSEKRTSFPEIFRSFNVFDIQYVNEESFQTLEDAQSFVISHYGDKVSKMELTKTPLLASFKSGDNA